MTDTLTTPLWRDAHLHLRQGYMTEALGKLTGQYCSEAVIMPNTEPAVETAEHVSTYRSFCRRWMSELPGKPAICEPLMTIKLTAKTTPEMIKLARNAGAVGVKVYPEGMTTNSSAATTVKPDYAVPLWEPYSDPHTDQITREMLLNPPVWLEKVFEACEDYDMIVLFHGELPGSFIMDREKDFLKAYEGIVRRFQRLKTVLEHITTEAAVNEIDLLYNDGFKVAATVTMHHLWMKNGLDDVMGGLLKPHWFCKPVAKRPSDHKALVRAVKMPNVFLGTDSAAHSQKHKECAGCCAGCLTANTPEMLVQLFEEWDILHYLREFTSDNMARFYGLESMPGMPKAHFRREEWEVPKQIDIPEYDVIVPFLAGQKLRWKFDGVR